MDDSVVCICNTEGNKKTVNWKGFFMKNRKLKGDMGGRRRKMNSASLLRKSAMIIGETKCNLRFGNGEEEVRQNQCLVQFQIKCFQRSYVMVVLQNFKKKIFFFFLLHLIKVKNNFRCHMKKKKKYDQIKFLYTIIFFYTFSCFPEIAV